jgi:hypothetical protein
LAGSATVAGVKLAGRPTSFATVRGNHMTQNMETDPFNVSMRKFLKQVGVTSQQAIEKAVAEKGLKGKGRLTVKAVITSEAAGLNHVVEGEIDLG